MYKLNVENVGEDRWKALGSVIVYLEKTKYPCCCDTPVDKISDLLCNLIVHKKRKILLENKLYYTKKWRKNWKYV